MTRVVFFALEAVLAVWVTAVVGGFGLWLFLVCVSMPLWLPGVAMGVGFLTRLSREWSLVDWVVGWHESIRRRIEET